MRKNCLSYPVEVVEDLFGEGGKVLADLVKKVTASEKPRIMLVADKNVVVHTEGLGTRIGRWVQAHDIVLAGSPVLITGSERIKEDGFKSAHQVVDAMVAAKVGKGDVVVVLGGGTVLDVACWAAAQIRGGIPVVRLPTTPGAMMDAAFAEYAALDHHTVKDVLRVPSVPAGVVIDTSFAATNLDGVWRGGYAVALRQSLGSDETLLRRIVELAAAYAAREAAALQEIVTSVVALIKKTGPTTFALWSAQRLEALSGYKLPYGYALALGILIDTGYAQEKGVFSAEDRELVRGALEASGALEGAMHSRHLLGREDHVLSGLDGWKLVHNGENIVIPTGLGTSAAEEIVDRGTMKTALNLLK